MPKISTPSKIKGTQAYSDNVVGRSELTIDTGVRDLKLGIGRSSVAQPVKNVKLSYKK